MKIRTAAALVLATLIPDGMTWAAEASVQADKASKQTLLVYTARNEELLQPVIDAYKQETGTEIKILTDQAPALIERMKAEGKSGKADILITVDAGNLWSAAEEGILRPFQDAAIKGNVPTNLKDPDHRWVGLSMRARTIIYNSKTVQASELSTYEALAGPQWKGKLCLRTSKKVYNQSLIAMMLADIGAQKTEEMVKGWVANLAQPVYASDTDVIKAVAAGTCSVGIVNTYYFGREIKAQPGMGVKIFWPNQGTTGVHVNVSGAGIAKYAPHPQQAEKFLKWLTEGEAQRLFTEGNMEYPTNPGVKASKIVRDWGEFKPSPTDLSMAGKNQVDAVKLMDKAGYR